MQICFSVTRVLVAEMRFYDTPEISGVVSTGQGAVFPRLVDLIEPWIDVLHRITVKNFPVIVAIANDESIFEKSKHPCMCL